MKFYSDRKPLYLKTGAAGFDIGAGLLQVGKRMNGPENIHLAIVFASITPSSAEA